MVESWWQPMLYGHQRWFRLSDWFRNAKALGGYAQVLARYGPRSDEARAYRKRFEHVPEFIGLATTCEALAAALEHRREE